MQKLVPGIGDHASATDAKAVEDLDGGVPPHLEVLDASPVGREEVPEAVGGAVQGDAAGEEYRQDDVGKGGREVDDLCKPGGDFGGKQKVS